MRRGEETRAAGLGGRGFPVEWALGMHFLHPTYARERVERETRRACDPRSDSGCREIRGTCTFPLVREIWASLGPPLRPARTACSRQFVFPHAGVASICTPLFVSSVFQLELLYADPFDPEAQARIAARIQQVRSSPLSTSAQSLGGDCLTADQSGKLTHGLGATRIHSGEFHPRPGKDGTLQRGGPGTAGALCIC